MKQKKFSILYVDPAWPYKCWSKKGEGRSPLHHYDVMSIEDIKALPVNEIADDNAVLLMWITFPRLPEALEVIKAWGFTYKTNAFTWVKRNKKSDSWFWGMGYYTRANAEICLLATKGKVLLRQSRAIHSIIDTPIEEHSKKPAVVRGKIVELFGDVPRIELFARQQAEGWVALGNQIDGKDLHVALSEMIANFDDESALRKAA